MRIQLKYQEEYEAMKNLLDSDQKFVKLSYDNKQQTRYAYNRMYLKAIHDNMPIRVRMYKALNVILEKKE